MKNIYKVLLMFFIPLLSLVVVSCGDDETAIVMKPDISEISASQGIVGDEVVLTGTNLTNVKRVVFGNIETEFSASGNTIQTRVPSGVVPGQVQIAVYMDNASDRISYLVHGVPVLSEVTPNEGRPGDEITLKGDHLQDISSIAIGESAIFEYEAAKTNIIFTIPAGIEPGDYELAIVGPGGEGAASFTILDPIPPVIAGVSHPEALSGVEVTITGTQFIDIFEVMLGDTEIEYSASATDIKFTVPEGFVAGDANITITGPGGTASAPFVVRAFPSIANITPLAVNTQDEITINGANLDLVVSVMFTGEREGTIISSTNSQMVVKVPPGSKSGTIVLLANNEESITSTQSLSITAGNVPTVTGFPLKASIGALITLEGTKLNLATEVIFPGNVRATSFGNKTANTMEVVVPKGTILGLGRITFVTIEGEISDTEEIEFTTNVLAVTIYDEALNGSWQIWGWGGAWDVANTEQKFEGAKSIKKTYAAPYEGIQIGGGNIPTTDYNSVAVSIYGSTGSQGQKVRLVVNGGYGDGQYAVLTIEEGGWISYEIPFTSLNNPAAITEIVFQSEFAGIIYVDKLGLK